MARADLHCHSIYSEHPSEWFLQRLGAAESYTDPNYIYKELRKKGMDYIVITDHNRIEGALLLKKKYPNKVIVGVEATTYFPEDNCKIHLLIYGLDELQYDIIQSIRTNIYELRDYLKNENLAHSVAHATYSVNKKLSVEHLEKLILLFDVFETRNGGRNDMHNEIWQEILDNLNKKYTDELQQKYDIKPFSDTPWLKGFTAGSDDHAGIFLGTTYTEIDADNIKDFLDGIRNKNSKARGRHNDFQGLAFTIYKIAMDFTKTKSSSFASSFFAKISDFIYNDDSLNLIYRLKIRNMAKSSLNSDDKMKINFTELIQTLQKEKGKNFDLDKRFEIAYKKISDIADNFFKVLLQSFEDNLSQGNLIKIIRNISSTIPGIFLTLPFYTTIHHLFCNRDVLIEMQKRTGCYNSRGKQNILWFSDTMEDLNGVSATLTKLHELASQKRLSIRIVGSHSKMKDDPNFINVPTMHTFELPYYEHQKIKVPSPLTAMEKIYKANPDKIIISTPGPIGLLALLAAKLFHVRSIGIYHTDFTLQTNGIKNDESLVSIVDSYTHWFYHQMDEVYVPSAAYKDILEQRGFDRTRVKTFPRGIEYDKFRWLDHGKSFLKKEYKLQEGKYLLYTGRISYDKNLDVILQAFQKLSSDYNDLYLFLVGDGPHREDLQQKYRDEKIIFTGKIQREKLPEYYSGSDLFLFPSTSDTFGMSVLEAQACCLPAFVSKEGGPKEIIEDKKTGEVIDNLDPQLWSERISNYFRMMETNPEISLEMKKNSRINVQQKSSWELFFQEFIN
jgi:glycosyltransferase involved in cell wall biosynthesis/predicted metal-dependent phosphoesterase TrpH